MASAERKIKMATPRRKPILRGTLPELVKNAETESPFAKTAMTLVAAGGLAAIFPDQARDVLHTAESVINAISNAPRIPSDLWNGIKTHI